MGTLKFAEPARQCHREIGSVHRQCLVSMGGTEGGWAEFQETGNDGREVYSPDDTVTAPPCVLMHMLNVTGSCRA